MKEGKRGSGESETGRIRRDRSRTVDRVNYRGRTRNSGLKLQMFMFITSQFFQGVPIVENFTKKPMEPILETQSFVRTELYCSAEEKRRMNLQALPNFF